MSVIIIIAGIIISNLKKDQGFVTIKKDQKIDSFISNTTKKKHTLPFNIKLEKFEIVYKSPDKNFVNTHKIPNKNKIIYEYKPIPENYISYLIIIYNNKKINTQVSVNNPITIKGYNIYQSSFDNSNTETSGLEIVRDPGWPFIYTGFILLIIGTFYGILKSHYNH